MLSCVLVLSTSHEIGPTVERAGLMGEGSSGQVRIQTNIKHITLLPFSSKSVQCLFLKRDIFTLIVKQLLKPLSFYIIDPELI